MKQNNTERRINFGKIHLVIDFHVIMILVNLILTLTYPLIYVFLLKTQYIFFSTKLIFSTVIYCLKTFIFHSKVINFLVRDLNFVHVSRILIFFHSLKISSDSYYFTLGRSTKNSFVEWIKYSIHRNRDFIFIFINKEKKFDWICLIPNRKFMKY